MPRSSCFAARLLVPSSSGLPCTSRVVISQHSRSLKDEKHRARRNSSGVTGCRTFKLPSSFGVTPPARWTIAWHPILRGAPSEFSMLSVSKRERRSRLGGQLSTEINGAMSYVHVLYVPHFATYSCQSYRYLSAILWGRSTRPSFLCTLGDPRADAPHRVRGAFLPHSRVSRGGEVAAGTPAASAETIVKTRACAEEMQRHAAIAGAAAPREFQDLSLTFYPGNGRRGRAPTAQWTATIPPLQGGAVEGARGTE